ncbi:MAG: hypothetical protein EPO30_04815 [Lysobacteraceae bacterium]|nr:MAG: hypothetical protein EPO30_04815 [Xanthomonadaceae bacterium]
MDRKVSRVPMTTACGANTSSTNWSENTSSLRFPCCASRNAAAGGISASAPARSFNARESPTASTPGSLQASAAT